MLDRLNIVLFEPEIPSNAGNIARTCACLNARLHLVYPLGFRMSDKYMKRSGMDYWDKVEVIKYRCADDFLEKHQDCDLHFFTGRTSKSYTQATYSSNPYLIFGKESAGVDLEILDRFSNKCLRIPMYDDSRSLNLSNAVAIAAYEVARVHNFTNLN